MLQWIAGPQAGEDVETTCDCVGPTYAVTEIDGRYTVTRKIWDSIPGYGTPVQERLGQSWDDPDEARRVWTRIVDGHAR